MITLYNVTSSNGFITDRNKSEDFIPDDVWEDFIKLCKQYDVLVMGRHTYMSLQNYNKELLAIFEILPIKKLVVSSKNDFYPKNGYTKIGSPQDVLTFGKNILLSSGPSVNTAFLKEKLIDKLILNILPIKIMGGLKVFEDTVSPLLTLISEEIKSNGRRLCIYEIKK